MSMLEDESEDTIIVEGARQVGKSYLVNEVLKKLSVPSLSFDLEKDVRLRQQIHDTEDFNDFKALMHDQFGLKENAILFLDEAQECPKLSSYLKSFKEDWQGIKVVLTGSSMNRFFRTDVRIPVGRFRSLCVFCFSFIEFVRFTAGDELADYVKSVPGKIPASRHQLLLNKFDEYLQVGGYPEAVKAFAEGKPFSNITETILFSLSEDFQRKEEYLPELFENVLTTIANNLGSPSKFSHIDATKYNAKRVLSALKLWHIVLEVDPQSLNPLHSAFLPKRYLHDLGVIHLMRSVSVPRISIINTLDPKLRTPLGGLFENSVLLNLLEGESTFKKIGTWKQGKKRDVEVDFVMDIPEENMKIPIECKGAVKIKKNHYGNILHYLNETNQELGVIVSAAPFEEIQLKNRKIINIPVYLCSKDNIRKYLSL